MKNNFFSVLKTILKLLIPPIIIKIISHRRKKLPEKPIQFQQTELSWDDAFEMTSAGYTADKILQKCKNSLLKVKNGEYPYGRDSVLFTEKVLFYPLLSSLLYISLKKNKTLNIIDFGGSLGSTYFQNRDILKEAGTRINWNIIEQHNFAECGKEYFSNDDLCFHDSINDVSNIENISVCLLSSVLPYLKEPYVILNSIKKKDIEYIIIDRTIFLENESNDILTIEKVPPEIYDASYPAWFLSLNKFLLYIENYFDIIFKWDSLDQHCLENHKTIGLGFLLCKR